MSGDTTTGGGGIRIAGNFAPLVPTIESLPTFPRRRRSNMVSPTTPTCWELKLNVDIHRVSKAFLTCLLVRGRFSCPNPSRSVLARTDLYLYDVGDACQPISAPYPSPPSASHHSPPRQILPPGLLEYQQTHTISKFTGGIPKQFRGCFSAPRSEYIGGDGVTGEAGEIESLASPSTRGPIWRRALGNAVSLFMSRHNYLAECPVTSR